VTSHHMSSPTLMSPSSIVQSRTVAGSRLPLPYKIPDDMIRESLRAAMNNGHLLTVGQRSELLEIIYQDVTKFTL